MAKGRYHLSDDQMKVIKEVEAGLIRALEEARSKLEGVSVRRERGGAFSAHPIKF
jgi:hypothetical protein